MRPALPGVNATPPAPGILHRMDGRHRMDGEVRLTRAELALLDRLATEEYGLPGAVLMENAGRGAAEEILGLLRLRGRDRTGPVAILAGPGNNGGDGCVVARHLANAGVEVSVVATRSLPELAGDAALMRLAVERMGIPFHPAESADAVLAGAVLVVDALLGTGFRVEGERLLRPPIADLVLAAEAARSRGATVVALDLPTGLDADSGEAAEPSVTADLTVTFAAWKIGFDARGARERLGRVVLASIGAPRDLAARIRAKPPPA